MASNVVRRGGALLVLMALFALIATIGAPGALAVDQTGPYVPGNPTCSDNWSSVKDDHPGDDVTIQDIYFDYSGSKSVSIAALNGQTIGTVIVKGGNGANVYTSGPFTNLVSPLNNGGRQADISHVTVCFSEGETTTTTEGETTTTTEAPTTTVTAQEVMVSVDVDVCSFVEDVSSTEVEVSITPADASVVTIFGPGGPYPVDGSGATLMLATGDYAWSGEAAPGYAPVGFAQGLFTLGDCTPEEVLGTTVTTVPTTSTSAVEGATVTTVAQVTASTPAVEAAPSTTVAPVTASTLPFTGFELQATALLGLLSLVGGVALLAAAQRRPEERSVDSLGSW